MRPLIVMLLQWLNAVTYSLLLMACGQHRAPSVDGGTCIKQSAHGACVHD